MSIRSMEERIKWWKEQEKRKLEAQLKKIEKNNSVL